MFKYQLGFNVTIHTVLSTPKDKKMKIFYLLMAFLLSPCGIFAENNLYGLKINRQLDKNTTENDLIKIGPTSG